MNASSQWLHFTKINEVPSRTGEETKTLRVGERSKQPKEQQTLRKKHRKIKGRMKHRQNKGESKVKYLDTCGC